MLPYQLLEKKYADFVGTKHACAVNTGTAALHVSLEALKLPKNSKVLVPDFTMYASGLAVYYARLTPVFVDCDENLLIDLKKAEALIDKDTKVIMVTHVYGRVVDMTKVMKLAEKYNLRVIEDAFEAQGANIKNKQVGSYDIGCFSLYRNKIIHAEEGGIITSNDKDFIDIVQDMKSMSFGTDHNYYHNQIGFNYRCTDFQANLALESLKNVKDNLTKRDKISQIYNSIIPEKYHMPDNRKVVWVYDIKHPKANDLVKIINKKGITARHSFKPMSMQPLFNCKEVGFNSKKMSQNVFYLNVSPNETEEDVVRKAYTVKDLL